MLWSSVTRNFNSHNHSLSQLHWGSEAGRVTGRPGTGTECWIDFPDALIPKEWMRTCNLIVSCDINMYYFVGLSLNGIQLLHWLIYRICCAVSDNPLISTPVWFDWTFAGNTCWRRASCPEGPCGKNNSINCLMVVLIFIFNHLNHNFVCKCPVYWQKSQAFIQNTKWNCWVSCAISEASAYC